jgi:hypothetical protein
MLSPSQPAAFTTSSIQRTVGKYLVCEANQPQPRLLRGQCICLCHGIYQISNAATPLCFCSAYQIFNHRTLYTNYSENIPSLRWCSCTLVRGAVPRDAPAKQWGRDESSGHMVPHWFTSVPIVWLMPTCPQICSQHSCTPRRLAMVYESQIHIVPWVMFQKVIHFRP